MKAKSNDAWDFKGIPPCDGREWKSIVDVRQKLGVTAATVWYHIRRQGWTIYRQNLKRTWILKRDVDSYLEFRQSQKRWYRRHQPKTWREEVCTDFDEATCKRIFWTAQQAALYMGVRVSTINRWGRKGKIPVFMFGKVGRGIRKWYSPSSLRHMKENEDHLKKRADYEKATATMRAGVVSRQVHKLNQKRCTYRKPIPPGWLTTLQVAERLDISPSAVCGLRRRGRLHGMQYYKGKLTDLEGWEQMINTRCRHWFYREDDVEELKNSEHYQQFRERGKTAIAIHLARPSRQPTSNL